MGLLEKHAALNCEVISLAPHGDFTLFFRFSCFTCMNVFACVHVYVSHICLITIGCQSRAVTPLELGSLDSSQPQFLLSQRRRSIDVLSCHFMLTPVVSRISADK